MDIFEALVRSVPVSLGDVSGKVFYSGRAAFSSPSDLYVLGLNPGGDPDANRAETVASHTAAVASCRAADWSAYRDESWEKAPPGTWRMQPNVLHMFRALDREPGAVPCSNLVFPRSRSSADLKQRLAGLVHECWPFHSMVLRLIQPKVIVCFGQDAGSWIRQGVEAHEYIDEFVERNERRWSSRAYRSASGIKVVVVTHPSRVDWRNPAADPTPLVARCLA